MADSDSDDGLVVDQNMDNGMNGDDGYGENSFFMIYDLLV